VDTARVRHDDEYESSDARKPRAEYDFATTNEEKWTGPLDGRQKTKDAAAAAVVGNSGHRLDRDGTVTLRRDKVYIERCLLFIARVANVTTQDLSPYQIKILKVYQTVINSNT
jgi:hypothetical protein